MFKRRRLKRVIVHLTNHPSGFVRDRNEEIILHDGEKLHHDIAALRVTRSGRTVREYEFCAGYDRMLEYVYE